jgi:hypothetical protein
MKSKCFDDYVDTYTILAMITQKDLEQDIENGLSTNDMKNKYHCGNTSVRYWLRKYGLKTNPKWNLYTKFTNDEILKIANDSTSLSNFLEKVGGKASGGAYYHYRNRLKKLQFDFSKFKSGGEVTAQKLINESVKKKKRLRRQTLHSYLQRNNIPYECYSCKIYEWNGRKLLLPIHHKDGDCTNNILTNLCYICPNCHSVEHYDGNGNIRL